MNRLITSAALAAALVVGTAGTAFATPKEDPCPGEHVAVYNQGNNINHHFICGPIKGETGDTGATGQTGAQGATGETGAVGPEGAAGAPGADGKDGQDGKSGVDGVDGEDGAAGTGGDDGTDGLNGSNGKDADASELANLRAVVTELNNRLFLLENTTPVATVDHVDPKPVGELPKTGSNTPLILLGALALLSIGAVLRFVARR